MPRRRSLILTAGLGLLVAAAVAYWRRPVESLNVIFLTLDTVRADHLGCYGSEMGRTPALDALAEKGVLFQRAYAPVPLTLPSHASLLTGCYPPVHGLHLNGKGRLSSAIPVLTEILQERDFETGAFVASYVLNSKFGLDRGFDTYVDDKGWHAASAGPALHPRRDGHDVMSAALKWMEGRNAQRYFCWIHLYDAHADPQSQYDAHEATFGDAFVDQPYDAGVAYVDLQLGRLMDFLQQRGLTERTLLVVVADHGEGLMEHAEREHGYQIYDSTLSVPLIVAGPPFIRRGTRIPQVVSIVDVMPTVLECLALEPQEPLCGTSLRPALSGGAIESRTCYAATDAPLELSGWAPLRGVVTEQWKYIQTTRPELYNLLDDPAETRDLAAANPEKSQELAALLDSMLVAMVERAASMSDVSLSAQERRVLESLGYAGAVRRTEVGGPQPLPDVKDMIPLYNELHSKLALAKQHVSGNRSAEAIVLLEDILDKVPGYLEARLYLGKALLQQDRLAEAKSVLERLIAEQPDRSDNFATLGTVLAKQGQTERAIPMFRQALTLDPAATRTRLELANALTESGNASAAMAELQEAVRRDPDNADAQAALKRMP
jgi:arylsulfatase A-like enzyme